MRSGSSLPTFLDNPLVPSLGVLLLGFFTLESGTDMLFRNVCKELLLLMRNNSDEHSSQKDLLLLTEFDIPINCCKLSQCPLNKPIGKMQF